MYELDDLLVKVAEGQKVTMRLFDFVDKLGFRVDELHDSYSPRYEISEYVMRLVYEQA